MKKAMPTGPLRIDTRFEREILSFHKKWPGPAPSDMGDIMRVAALAFSGESNNPAVFRTLCKLEPESPGMEGEPRSLIELWLVTFLQFPDYTLALMTHARRLLSKYDGLDVVLFRHSLAGTLATVSDGDLILDARRLKVKVSEETVKKRRQRWINRQSRTGQK